MTTTDPRPAHPHPSGPPRLADRTRPPRTVLAAAVAAPVLFTVGSAVFPALPADIASAVAQMAERREVLLLGRVVTGVGALLFLAVVAVLQTLVPRGARGSRGLRTGLALVAVGTTGNGVSQLVQGYAADAALGAVREAGVPLVAAGAVIDRVADGWLALPLGYWTVVAFGAGWLIVAAGLLRSGAVGRVRPAALAVGVVIGFALASPGWPALALLPFVLVVVELVRSSAVGALPAPHR